MNNISNSNGEGQLSQEFRDLEKKLQRQLELKEYELALQTTEEIIELCSLIDDFNIETWIDYYTQLKEHMFNRTYDEKYKTIEGLINRQEIITFSKFQNLMNLNYISDFSHSIQSLPESDIVRVVETSLIFNKPEDVNLKQQIDNLIKQLYIIIQ